MNRVRVRSAMKQAVTVVLPQDTTSLVASFKSGQNIVSRFKDFLRRILDYQLICHIACLPSGSRPDFRTMQMRFAQVLVLSIFSFVNTAQISQGYQSSTAPLNASAPLGALQNLTVELPEPPPSFDVTFEIGGPALRKTDLLLNVVDTLKQLSLGDFDAKIADGTEYKLDSYPEVSILINTPKRKRSLQARYVIWAIVPGVREMVQQKKFELAQFEITWDGNLLGWVHIVNNPPSPGLAIPGSQANDTLDIAKRSTIQFPSDGTNVIPTPPTTTTDPTEARLTTIFTPTGSTVGIYDVFFPIINALSDMAVKSPTHRSDGLVAGFEDSNAAICILPVMPFRTRPPFMDYEWLIRTLARIMRYMVEERRFGELEIDVRVDGVVIAYGRVANNPMCE